MKIYLIAVALFTVVAVPVESADNKKMTYQEFRATISSISKSITDLTTSSVLLANGDFRLLSGNAGGYRAIAMQMLEEDVSNQEKEIVVYAMQNLSLEDYVAFIVQLMTAVRDNKTNRNLLELALIPGFEWNTKLQDNWKSPKVRELIENLKASHILPADCNQYLDDVTSGRGAEHVKRMRRDGEL